VTIAGTLREGHPHRIPLAFQVGVGQRAIKDIDYGNQYLPYPLSGKGTDYNVNFTH